MCHECEWCGVVLVLVCVYIIVTCELVLCVCWCVGVVWWGYVFSWCAMMVFNRLCVINVNAEVYCANSVECVSG